MAPSQVTALIRHHELHAEPLILDKTDPSTFLGPHWKNHQPPELKPFYPFSDGMLHSPLGFVFLFLMIRAEEKEQVCKSETPSGSSLQPQVINLFGFPLWEWYAPNQFARQFGLAQHIPLPPTFRPILLLILGSSNALVMKTIGLFWITIPSLPNP